MTQWVENPTGGRARGPVAVARAWVEVLTRPRRFFRTGVAPGDQGPGFVFTVAVAAVATTVHLVLVPAARPSAGGTVAGSVLLVAVVSLLAAPLALHLVAAVQTALLLLATEDRGTVSETVQVLAYATAPGVVAGVPVPALQVPAAVYGSALLAMGTREVHDLSVPAAAAVSALPAALVFGVAFRGFAAAGALGAAVAATLG